MTSETTRAGISDRLVLQANADLARTPLTKLGVVILSL